jgi:catechol 2,3-dioxygenase-like lactoylglutathione lyase family enzyme
MDWKLELIMVPVADIDRSKQFYSEQLGFHVDVDHVAGPVRIVQMTPPGSGCSITISKGLNDAVPGTLKGVQICVADIEAAHAQLTASGVEITSVRHMGEAGWADGKGDDWNSFFFFDDPDGNSWAVQESPTMRAEVQGAGAPA